MKPVGSEMPRGLSNPQSSAAGRALSAPWGHGGLCHTHKGRAAEAEAAGPSPSTSAGEEAAGLWVQKLRPAVVPSHVPICGFPCWVPKGWCPGRGMCLVGLAPLSPRSLSRRTSEDKAGHAEGPGCTSGIRGEVIELQVGWQGHVLPRQAHVVEFQVIGVTAGAQSQQARVPALPLAPELPETPAFQAPPCCIPGPPIRPAGEALPRDQRWAPGGA